MVAIDATGVRSGTHASNTSKQPKTGPRRLGFQLLWLPLIVLALFIILPQFFSLLYAIRRPNGEFTLEGFTALGESASLADAVGRTLPIAGFTVLVLLVVLIPAVTAVHLWAPKLRTLLDVLCTLPLVVPAIAIVAGLFVVIRFGSSQGRGSIGNAIAQWATNPDLPVVLVGTYVVLALPFTYRSVTAGLSAIPLRTLVEASSSLGASTFITLLRVIVPNIRGPVMFSAFYAAALAFGEFTVAATLSVQTVPVWLYATSANDFRASIAMSLVLTTATWLLLIVATISADGFAKRRPSRKSRS